MFRGPVLYCLEEKDNGEHLNKFVIDADNSFEEINDKINSENIISLNTKGYKFKDTNNLYLDNKPNLTEASLKYIPYYCWSNRGENEMLVWVNEK